MSAMAFDTLRFAKTLREAGVPDAQAEAIAGGFGDGLREHVATKGDLDLVENRLSGRMDKLEAQLGGRMDKIEAQLGGRMDKMETMLRYLIGVTTALLIAALVGFIRGSGGG